jgi:hypothetical protein
MTNGLERSFSPGYFLFFGWNKTILQLFHPEESVSCVKFV